MDDVVVVPGIENDVVPSAFGDCTHHVDGGIAVKGGDLDGDHIFDLHELFPEIERVFPAADGRLQVKADQRNDLRHFVAMGEQNLVAGIPEIGKAEQPRVVSVFHRERGFLLGLSRFPADTRNFREGVAAVPLPVNCVGAKFENRLKEIVFRVPDLELCGVNTDRQSSGSGLQIVVNQGALIFLGPGAVRFQRQRHGRNDLPCGEVLSQISCFNIFHHGLRNEWVFPEAGDCFQSSLPPIP